MARTGRLVFHAAAAWRVRAEIGRARRRLGVPLTHGDGDVATIGRRGRSLAGPLSHHGDADTVTVVRMGGAAIAAAAAAAPGPGSSPRRARAISAGKRGVECTSHYITHPTRASHSAGYASGAPRLWAPSPLEKSCSQPSPNRTTSSERVTPWSPVPSPSAAGVAAAASQRSRQGRRQGGARRDERDRATR